jgi:hypothetical protein
MAHEQRYRVLEKDLIQGLSDSRVHERDHESAGDCPSPGDLRLFEAGKYGHNLEERDALMSHLADCDRCVHFMMLLKRRRVWRTRAVFVLASAAVVLMAVWTSSQHPAATSGVATIDLRLNSPTRGIEKTDGAVAAKVRRNVNGLRVILPPGSEGGYEYELLSYNRATLVLRGSAQTTVDSEKVILILTASLARLTPGKYSFALRHGNSDWEYYPLIVE